MSVPLVTNSGINLAGMPTVIKVSYKKRSVMFLLPSDIYLKLTIDTGVLLSNICHSIYYMVVIFQTE